MRWSALVFASCACCSCSGLQPASPRPALVGSDDVATAGAIRDAVNDSDRVVELVRSLAVEIGPRPPGTAADRRARDWAVARFRDAGMDTVWVQEVSVPRWVRGVEQAAIVGANPRPLEVLAVGFSVPTSDGGLTAPLLRVESAAQALTRPADALRGRILFIDHGMPRGRDGRGYGLVAQQRGEAVAHAGRSGAAAVLIRSPGTGTHAAAHAFNIVYRDGAPRIPVASIANPDADTLRARLTGTPELRVHLVLGGQDSARTTSWNVVGEIRGREQPDAIVLLAAHLDSWDVGQGALDDGAGVAITLATASELASRPERPRRTVRFALLAAEEIGLLGARAYAERHARDQHLLALEPDQGAGAPYLLRIPPDRFDSTFTARLDRVLAPFGVPAASAPSVAGPDLIPLREQRVATIDVAHDMTSFWDYAHSRFDTFDRIEPVSLRRTAAAYAVVVYLAANAAQLSPLAR